MMGQRGGEMVGGALPCGVVLLLLGTALSWATSAAAVGQDSPVLGTIAFASVGRAHFAYDVFGIRVPDLWGRITSTGSLSAEGLDELRLTDGVSINYNGQLVEGEARVVVLAHLRRQGVNVEDESSVLVFASERDGSTRIYFKIFADEIQTPEDFLILDRMSSIHRSRREILQTKSSQQGGFVLDAGLQSNGPALFDKPSVVGDSILYVSTKEPHRSPRESWTAVYSTSIKTQKTKRLTPEATADFSPSVSPSGEWVAVASSDSGFHVEIRELLTNLYVFNAKNGSQRTLIVKHAGWPSWADDHTIFFHRLADDGWWSIFRVTIPEKFLSSGEGVVQEERITPPGMHAITPAASPTGDWVAVATRRPVSEFRHIEIFSLLTNSFTKLTENISPQRHHYNPFVSAYSGFVGYHRCRANPNGAAVVPLLQEVRSPTPGLALVRVDGIFPSFSPDGSLLAFARSVEGSTEEETAALSGIFVCNGNGSGLRQVFPGVAFAPAWDKKKKNVLYASKGPFFHFSSPVSIVSIHNVDGEGEVYWKQLTKGSSNNAFPTSSPDGKYVVFRSMRSGFKNLYIMDAEEGEEKEIRRLTEGPWTDQHPNWSPSGEWIAFTSDRENPGSGGMAIFMVHPDGTGLHKVLESDHTGLTVHPIFSPDSKKLTFASDLAGSSAEPVAEPHVFQPYGEIFTADLDGSNVKRLTHNFVEDGTPAWSPTFLSGADLSPEGQALNCDAVQDTRWLNSENQHSYKHYPAKDLPSFKCNYA